MTFLFCRLATEAEQETREGVLRAGQARERNRSFLSLFGVLLTQLQVVGLLLLLEDQHREGPLLAPGVTGQQGTQYIPPGTPSTNKEPSYGEYIHQTIFYPLEKTVQMSDI